MSVFFSCRKGAARAFVRAALVLLLFSFLAPGLGFAQDAPEYRAPVGEQPNAPSETSPDADSPDASAGESGEQAGVAAAVEGEAWAMDAQGQKRPLLEGGAVYVGETVLTGPEGKVKLEFLDESVMDVGNESEVCVNALLYDPRDRSKSSQVLSLLKGLFRFVTGAITSQDPENLHMQAPLASIGIRGTITDHYVDVSEESVDGTPVRVINSEMHALRESSRHNEVVVSYGDSQAVLKAPDMVADVKLDMPVVARELTSFDKRFFGTVAIEPYSFDPEVRKTLRGVTAQPME